MLPKCWLLLAFAIPALHATSQTYYDQQRQSREYQRLREATNRAYSVPSSGYVSSYRPSSYSSGNSSSYSGGGSYYGGGVNNTAVQQLANQWRRNSGRYTQSEINAMNRRWEEEDDDYDDDYGSSYSSKAKTTSTSTKSTYEVRYSPEYYKSKEKYRRAQLTPEQSRKESFDSMAFVNRRFANQMGVGYSEREVYAATMNAFNDGTKLSAAGQERVRDAMRSYKAYLTQRSKAPYDTLADLMDVFAILPIAIMEEAAFMRKRFPAHDFDLARMELRSMNFFFCEDFYPEFRKQRFGDRMEDKFAARWNEIYKKYPDEALQAVKAVDDYRYNPLAVWADYFGVMEQRFFYYDLMVKARLPQPDKWLTIVRDQHWEQWKKTWPPGFTEKLVDDNLALLLAIVDRNKKWKEGVKK